MVIAEPYKGSFYYQMLSDWSKSLFFLKKNLHKLTAFNLNYRIQLLKTRKTAYKSGLPK